VSSFYCGVAGRLHDVPLVSAAAEANDAFNVRQSFLVLFMVIIGGLGST
jgi:branched-chain amino acid transport system permease protein